ncbi:hypothetical protein AJ79_02468 [Helicocarpus griseus UAMH5409]|uniref:Uncharacterized protein n=1 Tax=Helicocarpus griseus UAMH5409 TaxID=1447875 RepID=A0A2B7Y2N7_9EURO|nr:hypothetical protein AJ79_02468 [Helicocarpus griseus UAMH5409]
MQREPLADPFGRIPGRHGRSVSLSGEYHSPIQSMLSPPPVNPEPQFIAPTAAAQIVSADQNLNGLNPSAGTIGASVTPASLALLNRFLDNLLFNILMTAKSTNLNAIRPALVEVLKPRLAKEVVSAADEELSEYMGGGEDEELSDFRGGREPAGQFELERSWKLTRLRCMVYTRLGDMEEEDEEEHLRREGLHETAVGPGRFSNYIGHITPAAAIFLTSILEYIGEHSLIIAGEAASKRTTSGRSSRARDGHSETADGDLLVVEEMDMEKLALNATLGRLWRTWRKNVRTPMLSRTLSRESMVRRDRLAPLKGNSRASSIGTIEEPSDDEDSRETAALEKEVNPADIPIPVSENDVDEIEVPGYTTQLAVAVQARSFRPRSLLLTCSEIPSPSSTGSVSPYFGTLKDIDEARSHARSQSLPSSPYRQRTGGSAHFSPVSPLSSARDDQNQLETMIEDDELSHRFSGEVTSPPEIPPRSKQREELIDFEEDAESSDGSEFFSSAPASRLQSPNISDVRSPPVELLPPANREQTTPQDAQKEFPQQRVFSRSPRKDARNLRLDIKDEPQYQQAVNLVEVSPKVIEVTRKRRVPEPSPNKQDTSTPLDQTDIGRDQGKSASAQNSIVETSFVADASKTASQPTRASSLEENAKKSSGAPDQESLSSHSARRSASIRSGYSASQSSSRRNTKTSIGGNTTPRYGQPNSAVSTGSERAAVQRVTPSPSVTRRESGSNKPRRSVSIGSHRDKRPITSGSSTSQVSNKLKGLVGWQSSDNDPKVPFPIRTSTDTTATRTKSAETAPDPSNLDELIQSDETIHYTLTPRNMREMEDPNSPRWGPTRTGTSELADFLKKTSPSGESQQEERRPSATSSMLNGLRLQTSSIISPNRSKSTETPVANNTRPQPPPVHKSAAPQARDARVGRESMRDFADFIRSTGPDHMATVPENSSRSTGGLTNGNHGPANRKQSLTGAGASQGRLSKDLPKKPTKRLEARPAVTKDDGTADLIDFIREGPQQDAPHRFPGNTAPFRSTMGSDDFLAPGRTNRDSGRQSSAPSTHAESTMTKSVPSSFNSRTGLLDSTNRTNSRAYNGQQDFSGGFEKEDNPMPTRKQRRVKDPYAIDFDSDDEFDEELLSGGLKPHREEEGESLADFLRNAPPPPDFDQSPQLLSVNTNLANGSAASKARAKSATSMKSRLMRATSTDKVPSTKLSRSSLRSYKSNNTTASSPAGPTTPIADRPGLKSSHSNSQIESYPRQPPYSAHNDRQRNVGANGPPRSQRIEPMAYPLAHQSSTADLADFLRNTGPPEPPPTHSSRSSLTLDRERNNTGSFGRIFGRRKKQAV